MEATKEVYVDFSIKLGNGQVLEEMSMTIDKFRRFCQENLRGMCPNGRPPCYRSDDIVAMNCYFSDGRHFIWQRHYIMHGRHIGGWQKISDNMPADVARIVTKVVCSLT